MMVMAWLGGIMFHAVALVRQLTRTRITDEN